MVDGIDMYEVARSIVEDRDVAIVHGVVWEGSDGRYYSPFGIGLSLLAVPLYGGSGWFGASCRCRRSSPRGSCRCSPRSCWRSSR